MNKKNGLIFLITIVLATFFLGIGYAQIADVYLNITGSASADKQTAKHKSFFI